MSNEMRGFPFPFRLIMGGAALVEAEAKIKQNLLHLLLVNPGERVMDRDYGSGLRQLVHDPNNDALMAIVQHQITKAVGQWEPRIQIQGLAITQDQATLIIQLRYMIRQTQHVQNLEVPITLGGITS